MKQTAEPYEYEGKFLIRVIEEHEDGTIEKFTYCHPNRGRLVCDTLEHAEKVCKWFNLETRAKIF